MFIKILLMAYLNMAARVTVGDLVFPHINSYGVDESLKDSSDKATITLARNYKEIASVKDIKTIIKPGQPVVIESGYNGSFITEYKGYVSEGLTTDFPLEIKCDELYPLRKKNHTLSYRDIKLKELLALIAPQYKIECLDVNLGKCRFDNKSSYQVLEQIKNDYGFYSTVRDGILHVGFAYDFSASFTKEYKYIIGSNVKDYSKLKYETEKDFNTKVVVNVVMPDGKKKKFEFGSDNSDAVVKTETVTVMDDKTAKSKANAVYKMYTYDGYSGSLIAFGELPVHAGDHIIIVDKVRPEREGKYLCDKLNIDFNESGITKEIFLSYKLSS